MNSNDGYSARYDEALLFVANAHRQQFRKQAPGEPRIPYTSHLLDASSLVWIGGGDEDQAIAALLHDLVEHAYYAGMEEDIRVGFGDRVLNMVLGCSDVQPGANREPDDWEERVASYLKHLETTDTDTLVVTWADKTSNARYLVNDLEGGRDVFALFDPNPQRTINFYRDLADLYRRRMGDTREVRYLDSLIVKMQEFFDASKYWSNYLSTSLRFGDFHLSQTPEGTVGEFPFAAPVFVLTAANPMSVVLPDEENALRNSLLVTQLTRDGLQFMECVGRADDWQEAGFLLHGDVTEDQARHYGRSHGQKAIYRIDEKAISVIDCVSGFRTDAGWVIEKA
ncbi:MAG: DUF3293 domain-containing protein [Actinobacteria bacterium]|nr:DUF3293 domain-containing protein [Actinomycetota bacterium]